jgi:hypothetical protein
VALAVAGAILMPISLSLDWYAIKEGATGDNARFELSGWQSFETTDALMVLAAIATVGLLLTAPRNTGRLLMVTGATLIGLILVQLVDRPVISFFVDRSDISLEAGAWLGLLGAALIFGAGVLASRTREAQPPPV